MNKLQQAIAFVITSMKDGESFVNAYDLALTKFKANDTCMLYMRACLAVKAEFGEANIDDKGFVRS